MAIPIHRTEALMERAADQSSGQSWYGDLPLVGLDPRIVAFLRQSDRCHRQEAARTISRRDFLGASLGGGWAVLTGCS